jgi:murein DD-endopeptidase MepM/ murein hydrolase activator NlpD
MRGQSIAFKISGLFAVVSMLLAGCAGGQSPKTELVPAPGSYFTATAEAGDSVSTIARRYRVKEDDLLAMNDFGSGKQLRTGARIRIPAYASVRPPPDGVPAASEQLATERPLPAPPRAAPTTRVQVAQSTPVPKTKPSAPKPAPVHQSSWLGMDWLSSFGPDKPDAKINATFVWPLKGPVIAEFGPAAAGARNNGINIRAKRGEPVHAAAEGTVSYVGDELKGYGNLILIRHENGFVTAYAHSESVTVERGQHVAKGQVIAYAGATGDVTEPQLHFELRLGTKAINPQPYLVASK